MSDIWASDSESEQDFRYDAHMAQLSWLRLQETHGTVGYTEGLVDGKEHLVQSGFDTGFLVGASQGGSLGAMLGKLAAERFVRAGVMPSFEAPVAKIVDELVFDQRHRTAIMIGQRADAQAPVDPPILTRTTRSETPLDALHARIQAITRDDVFTNEWLKVALSDKDGAVGATVIDEIVAEFNNINTINAA